MKQCRSVRHRVDIAITLRAPDRDGRLLARGDKRGGLGPRGSGQFLESNSQWLLRIAHLFLPAFGSG
jgi:hypothetical protein